MTNESKHPMTAEEILRKNYTKVLGGMIGLEETIVEKSEDGAILRMMVASMEEYASTHSEELRAENERLKEENERLTSNISRKDNDLKSEFEYRNELITQIHSIQSELVKAKEVNDKMTILFNRILQKGIISEEEFYKLENFDDTTEQQPVFDFICKDPDCPHCAYDESENQPEESKESFKFLIGKDVRWRYIDWEEGSFTPWLKFRERDLGIFDDNSLDIVQFKP